MQQVNIPSQYPNVAFDNHTPTNKTNQSHSPHQRMLFQSSSPIQDTNNHTPVKNLGELELLYQKIQLLQNENKMLKSQLQNANLQIQQLTSKINSINSQAIFKTTTFELVVLQKTLEQLQQLKTLLQNKDINPHHNNQTLPTETTLEVISELKSKVISLEQKNIKLSKENSELQVNKYFFVLQHLILFPTQSETKQFVREGRKQLFSDPSEIRKVSRNSPIRFVNLKGSPNNPYKSPKHTQ
ncbi:unnamed protein product [Paramecium sonneborni]|uniref:Uncharacterized protein n=1 Tax=Paramecium sonneborni TaxID=65129 RepID=A0A8S1PV11_9CILI|nr:unnamed protein product [Paramecium sonneborni]